MPYRKKLSPKTFWHPPAVSLIELALPPECVLETEYSLRTLPQRVDMLIIRRQPATSASSESQTAFNSEATFLPALLSQLAELTLIEFKGGSDEVDFSDAAVLVGYACQYEQHWRQSAARATKQQSSRTKNDGSNVESPRFPSLALGFIAPRLSEACVKGLHSWGGRLEKVRPGLWSGTVGVHRLFFIETEEIWKHNEEDRLFYTLTESFLEHGLPTERMTEGEFAVYNRIEQWFVQLLEGKTMMIHPEKLQKLKQENERFTEEFLAKLPPERRLQGLRAEERLQGLRAEERLQGLTPSEVLKRFAPEEMVSGLTPDQREALKKLL